MNLRVDANADDRYSSSVEPKTELPDAPDADRMTILSEPSTHSWRPFSAFAVVIKIGTGGIGPEFATPLNRFMNLRGSFQIFDTKLNFRHRRNPRELRPDDLERRSDSRYLSVSYGFHLSPGVTIYGDNHIAANLMVPGGSPFRLGPDGYTSDPQRPGCGAGGA